MYMIIITIIAAIYIADTDYHNQYAVFTLVGTRNSKIYGVFMLMDTANTNNYTVFSGSGILYILCTMQYFRGDEYYLHYALRSFFGIRMLFLLCIRNISGRWILYILYYVVFSGIEYFLYYSLCSIFGGRC